MSITQQAAAKRFWKNWAGKGDEKQDTQSFWIALLRDVYGVERPEEFIKFEEPVKLDGHTFFIDGRLPSTSVLIEQKGKDIDLKKGSRQSDGSILSPFQQARRYGNALPRDEHPRWIVVSNFQTFEIHDMNHPNDTPQVVQLSDLEKEYHRLQFLVDTGKAHLQKEMEVSMAAGEIVGKIYDAFYSQYIDPNEESLKSLNKLCVRLVFCLYAEDAGIFGKKGMFRDYLEQFDTKHSRKALIDLFRVLDTKPENRDRYMEPELAAFPYVNGGLFADEDIEIPHFTDDIRDLLLHKASEDFNWSDISPTIFGAVFDRTLNPDTRRKGGMHYTSIENIHKVIDPLFLEELQEQFEEIKGIGVLKTRNAKLRELQLKLSKLTFFDPACGSGNFLTETYLSIRRLENAILSLLHEGQMILDVDNPIKVSIGQFYGIEINDFAVTVAKTALWIAESQMLKETEEIVHMSIDFLPLKSYANIVEGNALQLDWDSVVSRYELNYIIGNPPFVGYKFQNAAQKADLEKVAGDFANYGTLDYVSGWYIKAAEFVKGTRATCAFVSTNSVAQGEHVTTLWKPLFERGIQINFAHRTFRWDSEASLKAHVHCVIIGFGYGFGNLKKRIWNESGQSNAVSHINGYLLDAPDVFIDKRSKPWSAATPVATKGNAAMDDGHLTITAEERQEILSREPELDELIRRHMSADDFLNGKENYCFWLHEVSPKKYGSSKELQRRLQQVKDYRNSSNRGATKKMADYPMLFAEIRQPTTNYIMMPVVSSELRKYVPIAFLTPDIINSYASISIPDATLYHFGVLTSNVHMAWMRAVCGRLESRYRYATSLVYNTFPWPAPTEAQKAKIEQTAQAILDARAKYSDCTLAELYDEVKMPPELRTAHQKNDRAVMEAYGFWGKLNTEPECVAELMKMYQQLAKGGK